VSRHESDARAVDGVERPLRCGIMCQGEDMVGLSGRKDRSMKKIITIGLDLAKSVFQIHGVGPDGSVEVRRKLRRSELLTYFTRQSPCLVGMEACGGAHYWAREIAALGHE